MSSAIALFLLQDGLTTGLVYALVGVALVLVFSLTRVIMLFIGEFVGFGALTLTALQAGQRPRIVWLLLALGALFTLVRLLRQRHTARAGDILWVICLGLLFPALVATAAWFAPPFALPLALNVVLTLALVVPMAGYLYGAIYQPIEDASILTLLITAVGIHLVLLGFGLVVFGPDGTRSPALASGALSLGSVRLTGQAIAIFVVTASFVVGLSLFFRCSQWGTALRATAVNRLGARLVGIPAAISGQIAFLLGGLIATVCGLLIGPMTTIFYDTGFAIALKGFVAAVLGGLISYPLTAIAALAIGALEAFSSFVASQYKDAIVFSLILPVLLIRSFIAHDQGEEE
ncbi:MULTISPECIES: branched-chain amino acid ABC transporter permease [unclassified Beijerinckia]|uniref:branched-chain amino acid ABC transporter permease n=1 Tax=unclassified Beijerinckia TaxID=2638183 RepID=UPI0008979976|nr:MULTISPECIES: branched-chain amino acid ABC transporter permease [unclassified Beijerinckia]MDH7799031.1 branched-chain amino acid transport system permease protein [Beijerinckia sp. GAS462]SED97302.1 amino acid/amide ABC transporter membrane protein 1, HAAT family [Beijerinckia sp. 28-YEA-48]